MTVKDCYEAIGADYQEVLRRLANEERVKRFLLKFPGQLQMGQQRKLPRKSPRQRSR